VTASIIQLQAARRVEAAKVRLQQVLESGQRLPPPAEVAQPPLVPPGVRVDLRRRDPRRTNGVSAAHDEWLQRREDWRNSMPPHVRYAIAPDRGLASPLGQLGPGAEVSLEILSRLGCEFPHRTLTELLDDGTVLENYSFDPSSSP
jgi:hypothetical protein